MNASGVVTDTIYYIYDGNGVSGIIYKGSSYYFQKDVLGDIIAVKNTAGATVATYSYDAYGNCSVASGSNVGNINPFRYRGYYYDTETGFYYLQSRYYDPSIMRFINADDYELISTLASTIGQLNLYAYCNDNPIMYTDESGTVLPEIAASVLSSLLLAIGVILCVYLIYYAISQIDFSALIDYFNESFEAIQNFAILSFEIIKKYINALFSKKNKTSFSPKWRGVRIKCKSKKDAEEKARKRGGGKKPRFDKDKGYGRHFHPGVPEYSRYYHDHYFYSIFGYLIFSNDDE